MMLRRNIEIHHEQKVKKRLRQDHSLPAHIHALALEDNIEYHYVLNVLSDRKGGVGAPCAILQVLYILLGCILLLRAIVAVWGLDLSPNPTLCGVYSQAKVVVDSSISLLEDWVIHCIRS